MLAAAIAIGRGRFFNVSCLATKPVGRGGGRERSGSDRIEPLQGSPTVSRAHRFVRYPFVTALRSKRRSGGLVYCVQMSSVENMSPSIDMIKGSYVPRKVHCFPGSIKTRISVTWGLYSPVSHRMSGAVRGVQNFF